MIGSRIHAPPLCAYTPLAPFHSPDDFDEGMYKVRRILDHRATKGGGIEYEVEWAEPKINGEPWPNWWLPKDALTDDLIHGYHSWRSHGVPRKEITIDVSLVYEEVRRKLSNVMMNGAPTAAGRFIGPNRPRVHKLPMEQLSVLDVALGVLELARKHGGPPIQLQHGNKGQDDEWWQLIIQDLERVAAFCNFQHFLDAVRTWENVRLTGTRDCIPRSCRPAREMAARLKHLLDRLATASKLLANDPHTQKTSIHTILHLGH